MDAPDKINIVKIKCKKSLEEDEIDSASEYVCDMYPGIYKTKKKLRQHKARIHSEEKFIYPEYTYNSIFYDCYSIGVHPNKLRPRVFYSQTYCDLSSRGLI